MTQMAPVSNKVLAGCMAAGLLLFSPAAHAAEVRHPDIVLITVDTLRADHLGAYGHRGRISPRIDAFAKDALVFLDASTPFPLTTPAHLSLFTALYPLNHRVFNNWGKRRSDHKTLAEVLQGASYETAAFTSSIVTEKKNFESGFDLFDEVLVIPKDDSDWLAYRDTLERKAGPTTDAVLAWLKKRKSDKPLFLWVHYYDPHFPYLPPKASTRRAKKLNLRLRNDFIASDTERRDLDALYEGEVRYADREVGRLLDALRAGGLYEDAVVVFASDHGEVLGERGGFYGHHNHIYRETLHVPLLMKLPGVAPRKVEEAVTLMDLMPSLLSYLRIEDPDASRRDGVDLMPFLTQDATLPQRAFYVSTVHLSGEYPPTPDMAGFDAHSNRVTLQGIREGHWKYWQSDEFDSEKEFLFDLAADPGEKTNLAGKDAARTERFRRLLEPYAAALKAYQESLGLPPVSADDKEFGESEQDRLEKLRRLRSLGYA